MNGFTKVRLKIRIIQGCKCNFLCIFRSFSLPLLAQPLVLLPSLKKLPKEQEKTFEGSSHSIMHEADIIMLIMETMEIMVTMIMDMIILHLNKVSLVCITVTSYNVENI